jgi:ABC-type multidrug transport system ATPase subunit
MALTISGLSKTYPNGVQALKNVSLSIGSNMFGLLGPNGAGKSTLMRTIATLQEPDSGSITLDELNVLTQKNAVRQRLGYLPQEFGVYPKMSALEMLNHLAVMKGIGNAGERKAMVEALLQQTNLWEARKKALSTYSGGMKQRFGIAQALLGKPQLIIVDEPTAGLDPAERNRFLNLLSSIGRDVTVILSAHCGGCARAVPADGDHRGRRAFAGGLAERGVERAAGQDLVQGGGDRRGAARAGDGDEGDLQPPGGRPA